MKEGINDDKSVKIYSGPGDCNNHPCRDGLDKVSTSEFGVLPSIFFEGLVYRPYLNVLMEFPF